MMKFDSKSSIVTILLLIFSLFAGFQASGANKKSSAPKREKVVISVGEFTNLKVQDNVNVIYSCNPDSAGMVSYYSNKDAEKPFIFTRSGKTLKVQVTTNDVGMPDLPVVYVYSALLEKVENYSDFEVIVNNPSHCSEFCASLIGNGTLTINGIQTGNLLVKLTAGRGRINISGNAGNARFRLSGTGIINADKMKATDIVCIIIGGGEIYCNPLRQLTLRGLGSTKVYYSGNPAIKHSGGGKLIKKE